MDCELDMTFDLLRAEVVEEGDELAMVMGLTVVCSTAGH